MISNPDQLDSDPQALPPSNEQDSPSWIKRHHRKLVAGGAAVAVATGAYLFGASNSNGNEAAPPTTTTPPAGAELSPSPSPTPEQTYIGNELIGTNSDMTKQEGDDLWSNYYTGEDIAKFEHALEQCTQEEVDLIRYIETGKGDKGSLADVTGILNKYGLGSSAWISSNPSDTVTFGS